MSGAWRFSATLWLLPPWLDPEYLLRLFGPWAVVGGSLMVFTEVIVVPFLPGDTLLFTIGLFSANHTIRTPLWLSCLLLSAFAFGGNLVGYRVGRFFGPKLFRHRSGLAGRVFDPRRIEQARSFLERYGNRAVVMARFIPFVRTFITWMAGAAQMRMRSYLISTAIGAVLWTAGLTLIGFFLGQIDVVARHVNAALAGIIVVTSIPMVVEAIRRGRH